MTVTFIGHRDAPSSVTPLLEKTLTDLITNRNASLFYVGNHGDFDHMAINVLKSLQIRYSHIKYYVVLAYLPKTRDPFDDYSNTIYPEGLEKVPYRFAISERNEWMIAHSDIVVTHVSHHYGCSARFVELAQKRKKTVIRLSPCTH